MPDPELPIAERKRALLCGLLFSACMILAFPPVGLWGFGIVAITPLVGCAARTNKPWRAGLWAGAGSIPFWAFEHRWLIDVTVAGYPALVVYLSLYPALFVWIAARLRRRGGFWARPAVWFIAAALVWSGLETLRGEVVFYGYPWFYVGHPLIDAPFVPQSAALIGANGVSLTTAIIGGLFAMLALADRPARKPIGVTIVLIASIVVMAGYILRASVINDDSESGDQRVILSVIETEVPQSNKLRWSIEQKRDDFDRFVKLTRIAAAGRHGMLPDCIVWPETMFPGMALDPGSLATERAARLVFPDGTPTTVFADELLALQREIGIPMLVGALGVEGLRIGIDESTGAVTIEQEALFNSVFLIENGRVAEQRYDKVHLTPFGEVMPYISASDWLERKLLDFGAQGMSFDLESGNDMSPILLPLASHIQHSDGNPTGRRDRPTQLRLATPICFEATMPGVVRRLAFDEDGERRADVIVQLSNDGWFGRWPGGRTQHLQLCRWRAIELRTFFVRSVNTGLSGVIRNDGRFFDFSDQDEQEGGRVVMTDCTFIDHRPPSVRVGPWIPRFTLAFTALALILPMLPSGARPGRSTGGALDSPDDEPQGTAHADASTRLQDHDAAEPDPGGSA